MFNKVNLTLSYDYKFGRSKSSLKFNGVEAIKLTLFF